MDYRLPLNLKNTWETTENTRRELLKKISAILTQPEISNGGSHLEGLTKEITEFFTEIITKTTAKPKIAITGCVGAGKSTLINPLLGTDIMPTDGPAPTTSIAVYIKHIDDKPIFMEEDVWVFANQVLDADDKDCGYFWEESRLYDESYCRLWKIGAGGTEVLQSFGTRQGAHYDKNAGAAVVFLDAPVLKNCDLIDVPGYGAEKEIADYMSSCEDSDECFMDEDMFFDDVVKETDAIIFLSPANRFMAKEDIVYLKRLLAFLPCFEETSKASLGPLSNLFIVAAQAHTVNCRNEAQLREEFDIGCANLLKTIQETQGFEQIALERYQFSDNGFQKLRTRFFAYATDIPNLCLPLKTALEETLDTWPDITSERAKEFVRHYAKNYKEYLIQEIQKTEDDSNIQESQEKIAGLNCLLAFFENIPF